MLTAMDSAIINAGYRCGKVELNDDMTSGINVLWLRGIYSCFLY